jgi:acetyl esterase/lipase
MKPLFRALLAVCAPFAAALSGCAPVDVLNATIPTSGLTVMHDLRYMPGPRGTFDVYRDDAKAGTLPVVVFFYGGGWQSGNKDDYLFVAAALARRGMLVAVPDYRLSPEVSYPAFIQDAARAVVAVRDAAPSWGGDPHRLFVVGHSAGAYIAAMLALDPEYLAAAGGSRDMLAGAVGIAGPYDFLPIRAADTRAVFGAHADDPATQPANHVDGHAPPMLLLQGEADGTVFPRNATTLAARIRAAGGRVDVRLYPGVGHIGIVLGFAPLFRDRAPVLDDVAQFVATTPPISGCGPREPMGCPGTPVTTALPHAAAGPAGVGPRRSAPASPDP